MISKITVLDKFQGCILGGAIGDACGKPAEFVPRKVIGYNVIFNFPEIPPLSPDVMHPLSKLPEGSYTDDTMLNLCQIKYFINHYPDDPTPFIVVRRALAYWYNLCERRRGSIKKKLKLKEHEVNRYATRYAGTTTEEAAKHFVKYPTQEYSASKSNSCGPITRLAPFLLFRGFSDYPIPAGYFYSSITHNGPDALVSTSVLAGIIKLLFTETSFSFNQLVDVINKSVDDLEQSEMIKPIKKRKEIQNACSKFRDKFIILQQLIKIGYFEQVLSIGGTTNAIDVILTSIGILLITKGNFDDTYHLIGCVGGDADSVGSIACSLAGLLKGKDGIDDKLIEHLDTKYQIGGNKILDLTKDFYKASLNCGFGDHLKSGPFDEDKGIIEKDIKKIFKKIIRKKDNFLTFGEICIMSETSLISILKEINKRDKFIISETGLLKMTKKGITNHPICISSFLENPKNYGKTGNINRKFKIAIKNISTIIKKPKDENERWLMSNILECAGHSKSIQVLKKYIELEEKATSIQFNEICNKLYDIAITARNPAKAAEKLYKELSFIIVNDNKKEFKNRYNISVDPYRNRTKNIEELKKSIHLGGEYFVYLNENILGPIFKNHNNIIQFNHKQYYEYPIPISIIPFAKICSECEFFGIFIFPRRNALCIISGNETKLFTRQSGMPISFKRYILDKHYKEMNSKWKDVLSLAGGISNQAIYLSICLVMHTILTSDHGCSLCIIRNDKSFLGHKDRHKWLMEPIRLSSINNMQKVNMINDYLKSDGAVIVDSQNNKIIAYGQTLSVPNRNKVSIPYDTEQKLYKENRGKRHEAGAFYSTKLNNNGIVIVGSERGDISIFIKGEMISIL